MQNYVLFVNLYYHLVYMSTYSKHHSQTYFNGAWSQRKAYTLQLAATEAPKGMDSRSQSFSKGREVTNAAVWQNGKSEHTRISLLFRAIQLLSVN